MEFITPDVILRQHGKLITASDFVDLVCRKREVKLRQAKNIISRAYRKKWVAGDVHWEILNIYINRLKR